MNTRVDTWFRVGYFGRGRGAKRGCANGNVVARAWCQHVLIWSFLGKKINSLFIATSSSELVAFGPVTVRSGAGPRGEDT